MLVESPANRKSDAILIVTPSEDALIRGYIESLEQILSLPVDIQSGEEFADFDDGFARCIVFKLSAL